MRTIPPYDYRCVNVKIETLAKIQQVADARGMKIYALADQMVDNFIRTEMKI